MTEKVQKPGDPQVTSFEPKEPGSQRDPEECSVHDGAEEKVKEKTMDKTLADSFPTSDPPSSIPDPSEPDPSEDESIAA